MIAGMDIDDSGWRDLNDRLGVLNVSDEHVRGLIDHLASRLVGHFGADSVECHRGKSDPSRHAMTEVAAAALAHLAPVLDQIPVETLYALIASEAVGAAVPAPWDDHWRSNPRTASWRS